jgi:hypothetical protein
MPTPARVLAFGIFLTVTGVEATNPDFGEAWWTATDPDGVQRVNIFCGKDFFEPSRIVLKANVPVELTVSTMPGVPSQNFVVNVPGPKPINANAPIGTGQTKFAFNPGSPGNYSALCRDNADAAADPQRMKAKQGVLTVISP